MTHFCCQYSVWTEIIRADVERSMRVGVRVWDGTFAFSLRTLSLHRRETRSSVQWPLQLLRGGRSAPASIYIRSLIKLWGWLYLIIYFLYSAHYAAILVASVVVASFVGGVFLIKVLPLVEYYRRKYNEACDLCGPLFRRICRLTLEEGEDGRGQVVQRPPPPPPLNLKLFDLSLVRPFHTKHLLETIEELDWSLLQFVEFRRTATTESRQCDDNRSLLQHLAAFSAIRALPSEYEEEEVLHIPLKGGRKDILRQLLALWHHCSGITRCDPRKWLFRQFEDADDEESPSLQSAYSPLVIIYRIGQ